MKAAFFKPQDLGENLDLKLRFFRYVRFELPRESGRECEL